MGATPPCPCSTLCFPTFLLPPQHTDPWDTPNPLPALTPTSTGTRGPWGGQRWCCLQHGDGQEAASCAPGPRHGTTAGAAGGTVGASLCPLSLHPEHIQLLMAVKPCKHYLGAWGAPGACRANKAYCSWGCRAGWVPFSLHPQNLFVPSAPLVLAQSPTWSCAGAGLQPCTGALHTCGGDRAPPAPRRGVPPALSTLRNLFLLSALTPCAVSPPGSRVTLFLSVVRQVSCLQPWRSRLRTEQPRPQSYSSRM